jgi:GrpB-like predicted nucleotidyltransferase (UPF0157 family)
VSRGASVKLHPVADVAPVAERIVARFKSDLGRFLPSAEIHHIGASSMPFGHTKGDLDVNVRVDEQTFEYAVSMLNKHYEVAQYEDWTPTYASFSTDRYELPLGVQVTVKGSVDDFLLDLRDRMRSDSELLRRYDEIKLHAATRGPDAYWAAKNDFLKEILTSRPKA